MSDQNVSPKVDLLPRKKKRAKRKAKSPLNDTNNGTGTQVSTRKSGVKGKQVKDVNNGINNNKNTSSGYNFPDPNKQIPIMSFPQTSTGQLPSGPQGVPVFQQGAGAYVNPTLSPSQMLPQQPQQQLVNMPQFQASGPPVWASELIEDVRQIKLSMSKIDQIERTVNTINMKVSDLEVKVNSIEPKVFDVEKSCSFISGENDDRKRELEKARAEINRLKSDNQTMKNDIESLKVKNAALETKVTDQQSRLMRDNLLFYGVTERGRHEDCEEIVKEICVNTLELDEARNMTFDWVHRIGPFSNNKVRPIVARFHYFKEREIVRQKAYEKGAELKRQNLGIGQQWPAEVRETRKTLYPIMQRERSQGKDVKLVRDKLFIDNVEFKPQSQVPAPQMPRDAPPQRHPPFTPQQGHGAAPGLGFMSQQTPQRGTWVPPPPPVPPGHPGMFQWTSPVNRVTSPMQQTSQLAAATPQQQQRQPTPMQQQNSTAPLAQQGPSQQPVQSINQGRAPQDPLNNGQ